MEKSPRRNNTKEQHQQHIVGCSRVSLLPSMTHTASSQRSERFKVLTMLIHVQNPQPIVSQSKEKEKNICMCLYLINAKHDLPEFRIVIQAQKSDVNERRRQSLTLTVILFFAFVTYVSSICFKEFERNTLVGSNLFPSTLISPG